MDNNSNNAVIKARINFSQKKKIKGKGKETTKARRHVTTTGNRNARKDKAKIEKHVLAQLIEH